MLSVILKVLCACLQRSPRSACHARSPLGALGPHLLICLCRLFRLQTACPKPSRLSSRHCARSSAPPAMTPPPPPPRTTPPPPPPPPPPPDYNIILPIGWAEAWDAERSLPFYHCLVDNRSQYVRPTHEDVCRLPPGWYAAWDGRWKRYYYFCCNYVGWEVGSPFMRMWEWPSEERVQQIRDQIQGLRDNYEAGSDSSTSAGSCGSAICQHDED